MSVSDLPTLNAILNSIAFTLLISGFIAIKRGNEEIHKRLMISALVVSAFFLTSYLTYHFQVPSQKFPELGWIRTVYLLVLIPHIILAVVMLPLIGMTFYFAFKNERKKHKKWARITFPIWSYVSLTGVIVYWMLYHLAPNWEVT